MGTFQISKTDRVARIVVGDRLTASEAPALQAGLKAQMDGGASEMIFDFSGTTSLDSTGIGLLIAASNSVAAKGGAIRLVNVPPDFMRLLQSMRLVARLHAQTGEGANHG